MLMLSRVPSNSSHNFCFEQYFWASSNVVYSVIKDMPNTRVGKISETIVELDMIVNKQ